MEVQASPAIKIRFPSAMTKNYWAIEEQIHKTTYAVPFLAALMAVACAKPIERSALFAFMFSKVSTSPEVLEKTLSSLLDKKIVLPAVQSDATIASVQNWKKSGWADAADYHFFTWDAPFLDYSKEGGGHDVDRKKMLRFQALQQDIQRFKKYKEELFEIPLPSMDAPFPEIEKQSVGVKIQYLLACIFGKKGEKPCHWSEVPLIRRTSPSGGSRHPTEGYFLAGNASEIKPGFYHIRTDPLALCRLSNDNIAALDTIVLTTIFERNMYRYREPRTFRTVHMDIGHILASIESLSSELGFKATVQLHVDEEKLLKRIGASKLEEGIMATAILQKAQP